MIVSTTATELKPSSSIVTSINTDCNPDREIFAEKIQIFAEKNQIFAEKESNFLSSSSSGIFFSLIPIFSVKPFACRDDQHRLCGFPEYVFYRAPENKVHQISFPT